MFFIFLEKFELKRFFDKHYIIGKNENNEIWLFYDNKDDVDEISFINGRKK